MKAAFKLMKFNTGFQAGMAAIETCMNDIVQRGMKGRRINIYTESLSFRKTLEQSCTKSLTVK